MGERKKERKIFFKKKDSGGVSRILEGVESRISEYGARRHLGAELAISHRVE